MYDIIKKTHVERVILVEMKLSCYSSKIIINILIKHHIDHNLEQKIKLS